MIQRQRLPVLAIPAVQARGSDDAAIPPSYGIENVVNPPSRTTTAWYRSFFFSYKRAIRPAHESCLDRGRETFIRTTSSVAPDALSGTGGVLLTSQMRTAGRGRRRGTAAGDMRLTRGWGVMLSESATP